MNYKEKKNNLNQPAILTTKPIKSLNEGLKPIKIKCASCLLNLI